MKKACINVTFTLTAQIPWARIHVVASEAILETGSPARKVSASMTIRRKVFWLFAQMWSREVVRQEGKEREYIIPLKLSW